MVLQEKIYKLQTGTAQPGVNKANIANLNIPIPPLKRQEEIVKQLNDIYTKNIKLQEEIELNKQFANNVISGIVKKDDTSSVNTEPIDEVQNEIVSLEEEVIIEPKPKVKKIVKKVKKVKKHLVIVEEDNEV